MSVHVANIFDDSCKYQHFVSWPQKSEFQIHHPYKGAESTGCLVLLLHTNLSLNIITINTIATMKDIINISSILISLSHYSSKPLSDSNHLKPNTKVVT